MLRCFSCLILQIVNIRSCTPGLYAWLVSKAPAEASTMIVFYLPPPHAFDPTHVTRKSITCIFLKYMIDWIGMAQIIFFLTPEQVSSSNSSMCL
jgi:hypothetical protein